MGESAASRAGLAVMERARIKNGEGASMRLITGLAVLSAVALLTSPVVATAAEMRGVTGGSTVLNAVTAVASRF